MVQTSLRSVIVPVIALVVIVVGVGYLVFRNHSTPLPAGTLEATTTPTSVTPPPAQTTGTGSAHPAPAPAPAPTAGRDGMSVDITKGTVPYTSTFSLTLNTNHACTPSAYTLDFGDNITQTVQVPLEDCKKTFYTAVTHQYARAGTFTARLLTKPVSKPGVELAYTTITVKNPAVVSGTGTIKFSTSPISGNAPLSVEFNVFATDSSESTGVYYTIVFGDGQTATFPRESLPSLTHVFSKQGSYLVTVNRRTECAKGVCSGPTAALGNITITVN